MTRGRRIVAARYLRTLATIETLSALGNDSEVRRLLAGIDPIEARELASELDFDNEQGCREEIRDVPRLIDVRA